MKTYLINLEDRKDRLESAKAEFKKVGLEYDRVNAIDSRALSGPTSPLVTSGVQGCWESHKICYSNLLASGENYALICEDDLQIKNVKHFHEALDWATKNNVGLLQIGFLTHGVKNRLLYLYETLEMITFKVIYLITRIPNLPISFKGIGSRLRVAKYGKTLASFIPDSFFPGTHCYLISRETAQKILSLNDPQFLSADEFLIALSGMRTLSLYRTRKSVVSQSDSVPSIESRFVGVNGK
jgi:glycosyl transferase family 25